MARGPAAGVTIPCGAGGGRAKKKPGLEGAGLQVTEKELAERLR
ncbi:MAG: hypothetical protein AVDCRST_MAG90-1704 [uncultured Microvirga sp.]|uniref:Uncharacterized protein n=1 Tax=uncultured Microvirga sp. TaxID=412392 RepID=A0A6J4LPC7_9HYPH|nr:MAG: hypothetical protein AVDCRST_MAG90-1704 [uncultured Microvirga sp.]